MRAALFGLTVAGLILAGGQDLFAQDRPKDRAKFQDRVEWMTMWKLMEALDLDKPTADKVYEIRRQFLGKKKELIKEIGAEIESLRQQLQDPSDQVADDQLAEKIRGIREKRKRLEALMDEQFVELSKILSVRQQAKLVLFIRDFREELRSLFRKPKPGGRHPSERGLGPTPPPEGPPLQLGPSSGHPPDLSDS
jgi:hypothetical protein